MPTLPDARHERFAQNLASGMGVAKALRDAGFELKLWDKTVRDFYVYALADTADQVFYIGKGKRQRCLNHEKIWRSGEIQNVAKAEHIERAIHSGGIRAFVIQDDLRERAAFALERRIIKTVGLSNLTNASPGGALPPEVIAERAAIMAKKHLRRIMLFDVWLKRRHRSIGDMVMYMRVVRGFQQIAAGLPTHAGA